MITIEENICEEKRESEVTFLDWKSDGSLLAVGIFDRVQKRGFVRIFDLNGVLRFERIKTPNKISCLKWNRDGNYLLVGSFGNCAVWSLEGGNKVKLKGYHLKDSRNNLADWNSLVTFAVVGGKNIDVFTVEPRKSKIKTFNSHCEITSIKWDLTGKLLASGSADGMVNVWRMQKKCFNLHGHHRRVNDVTWSNTGQEHKIRTKIYFLHLALMTKLFDYGMLKRKPALILCQVEVK